MHPEFQLERAGDAERGKGRRACARSCWRPATSGAEYDAWPINIGKGDAVRLGLRRSQPELQDPRAGRQQRQPAADPYLRVWRDHSVHLAENVRRLPADRDRRARAHCLSWLFWQMGSRVPYLGGGFGHFYAYAPAQDRIRDRPLPRWRTSASSTCSTGRLADERVPGYGFPTTRSPTSRRLALVRRPRHADRGKVYGGAASSRAGVRTYKNLRRWTDAIAEARPGREARAQGEHEADGGDLPEDQLRERHDASDFDTKTQDKLDVSAARCRHSIKRLRSEDPTGLSAACGAPRCRTRNPSTAR